MYRLLWEKPLSFTGSAAKRQVYDDSDTGQMFFENRVAKDDWILFTDRRGLTIISKIWV